MVLIDNFSMVSEQIGLITLKINIDPIPEDQALVSPHRGVIVTLLNMIGMLEYWSIGVLGLKSELSSISDHLSTHVFYEVYCDPKPIIPSLHHSITPIA